MSRTKQDNLGDLHFRIIFKGDNNNESLLPSFDVFEVETTDTPLIFTLTVDDSFLPSNKGEEIGQFDCGGTNHGVYQTGSGDYQILISDVNERKCSLLQAKKDCSEGAVALTGNWNMRNFGLNNTIMMMYAFSSVEYGILLMHASVIRKDGKGYLCLGKSGTGKSTHTQLWLKHIEGTDLMNDDNPVVRYNNGETTIYGSPWSGKTPCYRNIKAPIGAFLQLKQAPYNKIRRQTIIEAFASMLPSCSVMKWDKRIHGTICDTISKVMNVVPNYILECLPDEAAARLSYSTMRGKDEIC